MFNQGIVVYQIKLPPGYKNNFMIESHDLTYISIDGNFQETLDRTLKKHPEITLSCESTK